jgi:hypothetical protein
MCWLVFAVFFVLENSRKYILLFFLFSKIHENTFRCFVALYYFQLRSVFTFKKMFGAWFEYVLEAFGLYTACGPCPLQRPIGTVGAQAPASMIESPYVSGSPL